MPDAAQQAHDERPATGVEAGDLEILSRGPIHEAFAALPQTRTSAPRSVPEFPPGVGESVPRFRPAGAADTVWIPGYWDWNDEVDSWVWITGVCARRPPADSGFLATGSPMPTVAHDACPASGGRAPRIRSLICPPPRLPNPRRPKASNRANSAGRVNGCRARTNSTGSRRKRRIFKRIGFGFRINTLGRPPDSSSSRVIGTIRSITAVGCSRLGADFTVGRYLETGVRAAHPAQRGQCNAGSVLRGRPRERITSAIILVPATCVTVFIPCRNMPSGITSRSTTIKIGTTAVRIPTGCATPRQPSASTGARYRSRQQTGRHGHECPDPADAHLGGRFCR